MLWKCCTQYASKFGKLSSGHRTGKVSFHSNPKERQCKECANYHTITLISHANKVMLKVLQARLQQYMNGELPDIQAGFQKAEEPIKLPTFAGSSKKQESSRRTSISAFWLCKAFDSVDHNKLWRSLKGWVYQTIWPASWEICIQVRKQQLELDMEQQTGSK